MLEGEIDKLVDLTTDVDEQQNLLDSMEPQVIAAREKFEAVIRSCPGQDARPQYDPTPPQPWDRKQTTDGEKTGKKKKKSKRSRRQKRESQ